MNRAYWSEWLKINQPGTIFGGAGSMVAFAIFTILLTVNLLGTSTAGGRPNSGLGLTSAQVASSTGFAALSPASATFLGLVALVLFAISIGTEYSNGTLRNLLVRQPNRLKLLAGKMLALGTFVTAATLVAIGAGLLTALILLPSHNISTAAWFTGNGIRSLLFTTSNIVLSTLAWGILGAIIALVLRSMAAAISVGLAYVLVVENLLLIAWSDGTKWLPGKLFSAVANGGDGAIAYPNALFLVLVYLTVGLIGAGLLFRNRDVAA